MTDTLENIEKISTELKTMKSRLGVLKGIRGIYLYFLHYMPDLKMLVVKPQSYLEWMKPSQ